jgi:hypothetical protein
LKPSIGSFGFPDVAHPVSMAADKAIRILFRNVRAIEVMQKFQINLSSSCN